ncbi:MAG: cytochrome c [Gammaproteobacteria bacterium]|nr:cytochrome c [Gammaproteobacteria bacterium]MCB1923919.1 cytochrome c [Gammaproteobacteria bacterium]
MKTTACIVIAASLFAAPVIAGGNANAGKEKSQVCAGCHGADGNATVGANPRLAGQYESYLYRALTQYKSGARKDLLMGGMVANLSDQDMRDLAAWFSSQDGNTLSVLPEED